MKILLLACLTSILYTSTNGLALPNGFYHCACFSLHPPNGPHKKGNNSTNNNRNNIPNNNNNLNNKISNNKNHNTLSHSPLHTLSVTNNENCSNDSTADSLVCCTQSKKNEIIFCCLDISPKSPVSSSIESSKATTTTSSSPSPQTSNPINPHGDSHNEASPLFSGVGECAMSGGEKKLVMQGFQASASSDSKPYFHLKYILAVCIMYPFLVIALFLVSFYISRQRQLFLTNQTIEVEEQRRRRTLRKAFRTRSPSPALPPTYSSISPPPYGQIFTIPPPLQPQQQQQQQQHPEVEVGAHPLGLGETLQAEQTTSL